MIRGDMEKTFASKRRRGLQLLTAERSVEELRARLLQTSENDTLIREIRTEAKRMGTEGDPELTYSLFRVYRDTGERLSYERVYFERRKRLNAFAIMSLLEPEQAEYREALHNTIWSICNEFTWCLPAHFNADAEKTEIDLFAAETGFALSELLLLAGDSLPDLLKMRMANEVENRLLRPFLEEGPYGWEKADHNWAAVCAGSIGSAAIHLVDEPDRLSRIVERVLGAMDCYLSGFGDDGVCAEGYLYWQYGFGYYVYFAQLLKAASAGEFDLFASDKVKAIALFQQKCFTGGNSVVNFSDSLAESGIFLGLSSCLHQEYEEVAVPDGSLRAPYAADHCGRWAPALRNVIWQPEGESSSGAERGHGRYVWPSESHYLPDAKWLISRHADESGDSFSFAAKGGHNDEPHNHNDIGHFLIHADGDAYLADLGSGMYSSHYFGPERYTLWCNGSQGHSVPIIGGEHQRSGRTFHARTLEAAAGEHEDRLVLEMSMAYEAAALTGLERQLHWNKIGRPSLTLTDTFTFDGERGAADEHAVVERFITLLEPMAAGNGRVVLHGKRRLVIHYETRAWEPILTPRSDIDHFGRERLWHTLDFKFIGESTNRVTGHFVFQFED